MPLLGSSYVVALAEEKKTKDPCTHTNTENTHTPDGDVPSRDCRCALWHGPLCFVDQVEVRRSYRGAIVSGISTGSVLSSVSLAPSLVTRGLPPILDVVHTVWSRNPFGALPAGEAGLGGVLEYTLRNAASGAEVPLPGTASPGDGPPMRFLVAIGAY